MKWSIQLKLEHLLFHNPAVIYSCQASGDYRATFVSANSFTLVGYEAEEFLNNPSLWIDNVHPDDLPMVLTKLSQLNEKDYLIYEYRFRHKNGSYRWMQDELKLMQDEQGNPTELIGYWIDITERKQSEKEIRQKNAQLQAIFAAFPDLFFRTTADGTIIEYRSNLDFELYITPEEFIGKRMQDVLPVTVGQQFQQAITQVQKTQILTSIEYSLSMPSGLKYYEARLVPLESEQLIIIIRDISTAKHSEVERQKAKEALYTRLEFEKLIGSISTHFINLKLEEIDRGITEALAALTEFSGFERSYIVLYSEDITFSNIDYQWHTSELDPIPSHWCKIITAPFVGKMEKGSQFETISILDVQKLDVIDKKSLLEFFGVRSFIAIPIVYQQTLLGMICFCTVTHEKKCFEDSASLMRFTGEMFANVIQRKRTETALQESQARFNQVTENIHEVFYLASLKQSQLFYLNHAYETIWGRSCQSLYEQPDSFLEAIYPEDRQQVIDTLQNKKQGKIVRQEYRIMRPDGSVRWILDCTFPLQNNQGEFDRCCGVAEDITERKQAELEIICLNQELENRVSERTKELEKLLETLSERTAQLETLNQELDSFSYSVSHDLRAPLRHINGFVHGLKKELEKSNILVNNKVSRYLQIIDESSQKMGNLIDGLLTLSKVGRRELVLSPVALQPLVETAINLITSSKNTENIRFKIGNLPTVKGDVTLLQQVFVNLIDNAVKFSQDKSPAFIEINCTAEQIIFVKDNGIGFSMEYADQLFGAFQRLHPQQKFKGNGIGLSIVQRIIHRHNGQIWAESEPDKGATFFFTLN